MSENFSDALDQKYRLDELLSMAQNAEINALHDYIANLSAETGIIQPPMDFWISEIEKNIPFTDKHGRDLQKDVNEFFKANGAATPLTSKTMEALKFVAKNTPQEQWEKEYQETDKAYVKEFMENFKNQKFASPTSKGHTNGAYLVEKVQKLQTEGSLDEADFLMKTANALADKAQPGHFPIREIGKYSGLILSLELTNEQKQELIESINQPEAAAVFAEMYNIQKQNEIDGLEFELNEMLGRIDQKRLDDQRADFAYSKDFKFSKDDFTALTEEDKEAFDKYISTIKDTLPASMPDEEKENEAYEIISKRQDERLNEKLEIADKDNEFLKRFEECTNDIRSLTKDDDKRLHNSLEHYDNDFAKSLKTSEKLMLKFKWMAGNVRETVVRSQGINPPAVDKIQKIHRSMIQTKLDEAVTTMARCDEKISDLQLSAREKGHIKTLGIDMKIKGLKLIQSAYVRNFNRLTEKKAELNRNIERNERQLGDFNKQIAVSDMKYLQNPEFDTFTMGEKKLLYDFSMAAHKSFTKEESEMLVAAYLASDGRFNPNMLAKYDGHDLSEAILTANRISLDEQETATHEELKTVNKMDYTLTDHAAVLLGNEKLAMGITAAQKRFLIEQYDRGAAVEDLQAVAGQFYSKSGFSLEDAKAHLDSCRQDALNTDKSYTEIKNQVMDIPADDPLALMAKTAKTLDKTLMTSFRDAENNTAYQLKAARNGRQFVLKTTNLETGDTELIRGTQAIREALAQNSDYGVVITNSTRECIETAYAEHKQSHVQSVESIKESAREAGQTVKKNYSKVYDKASEIAGRPKEFAEKAVNKVKKKVKEAADSIEI